jgi:hypothetical protein
MHNYKYKNAFYCLSIFYIAKIALQRNNRKYEKKITNPVFYQTIYAVKGF